MTTLMERARALVDRVGELPAVPAVVLKAMEMLNDPSVTVKRIQEQILLDPALTACVLKVANSALYGLRKEVNTVSYAINLMGYNTTKSILMSHLTKSMYQASGSAFIHNTLWKHAVASGVFARYLADELKTVNREEAFIAALLHDIGKGVLARNLSQPFSQIVEKVVNEGADELHLERQVLGVSHVEAGYLLMQQWRFSDATIEALVYHHNQPDYEGRNPLVPIVSLANKMAHLHGYAFVQTAHELVEARGLGLDAEHLSRAAEKGEVEINHLLEIL